MPSPSSFYVNLIFATIFIYCFQFSIAGNNETDLLALREIKARITHDPLGVMSSWNDSLHFCEWLGVTCGNRHQRVIMLDVESSGLTGTLSPFVGNLSFLWILSLSNNSFMGSIPPELGRLHRLQYLMLFNNSFGGEIPSNISHCSNLTNLSFANNMLVGDIPFELGSLLNLRSLSFEKNSLTGKIPSFLGNLTSLSELSIATNNLIGTIPDSLGRLKRLTFLSLFENKLSGSIPPSIFNLSSLMFLHFGFNYFLEGTLPLDLGTMLPNLHVFSIATNQFTGSIPDSISNASNLVDLELSSNNLQGQVPSLGSLEMLNWLTLYENSLGTGQPDDLDFVSSLANATMLEVLGIGKNNFRGIFPNIVCNFSMLSRFRIDRNEIAGQIPSCIENLASLQWLDAHGNQLSGVMPSNIGKIKNLGLLNLGNNQLAGHIPSSVGNITEITILNLSGNNLAGRIPSSLGNCRYLQQLHLSQNNLSGRIPLQLFGLSSLFILNLSNNPLTGSLPTEVGKLKNLGILDFSNTRLSGEIPSTLGACTSSGFLYMQGNFFQGPIPPTLITLKGLRHLDLSRNNLTGKIPSFLASFPLQMLNLSYNNLHGEVPIGGIFSKVSGLSIIGNIGLCGGIPELKLPLCNPSESGRRRLGQRRRLIIAILAGFFGVTLFVACVTLFALCRKKMRKEVDDESNSQLINLSYQSLLKATNGFSSEKLIGKGSVGVVYKGTLDLDGKIVAIKVFNTEHRSAFKSFMAECEVLKNVRHRNLVKVITVCSSTDYQGNDFKALVFEYMVNGSLDDWLHQKQGNNAEGTSTAPRNLNLLERLDIVVDVAFALEYLHHHGGVPIVHCDLKPSNILLDDEMVAHVGDFGLSKFLLSDFTGSHENPSSSVGVRGTFGYAPPEYGMGNEPSTYGDVYSFGILVMEMLTGRRPTDNMFTEGLSLHGFAKAALPDRVMEILDQTLRKDVVGEETNTRDYAPLLRGRVDTMVILEALTSVFGIALSCSAELPQQRLDMRDVARKLSSVKNKLLRIRLGDRGVHNDAEFNS